MEETKKVELKVPSNATTDKPPKAPKSKIPETTIELVIGAVKQIKFEPGDWGMVAGKTPHMYLTMSGIARLAKVLTANNG